MRPLPSLTATLADQATTLSARARAAREAAPFTTPQASMSPAVVGDGVATVRLYDYIDSEGGYWGISAEEFAEVLDDDAVRGVSRIDLRINSGGGAVWDGLAILNVLRSVPTTVRAIVDGVAASAASFIAVACDEVVMMPNSRMMIHDALGLCIGQAADMREYADFLDDSSSNIAEIYAARAGGSVEDWRTRMTERGLLGSWYSAQEAVDIGLADRVGLDDAPASEDDRAPEQPRAEEPVEQPRATTALDRARARFRDPRHDDVRADARRLTA